MLGVWWPLVASVLRVTSSHSKLEATVWPSGRAVGSPPGLDPMALRFAELRLELKQTFGAGGLRVS